VADPRFYSCVDSLSVTDLCDAMGATLKTPDLATRKLSDVAAIGDASSIDLTFLADKKYRASLGTSQAGACLLTEAMVGNAPAGMALLVVEDPQRSFADAIRLFHPAAPVTGISDTAHVDGTAKLEEGVSIGAGAVIGAAAEIGAGTSIAPGAVIGPGVTLGRDCSIGPNVTVEYALVGDRVFVSANASIGADGFGYAMGPEGHKKIPQIGRVILQDDVEVGSGTTIDRGALGDTVIGEGTKIDNLVQIGHNCQIGRHCVIVAFVGLAGSTVLEDFVVMGGQASTAGHLTIGAGAMLAARTGVVGDLEGGSVYGGAPARPVKQWMREVAAVAMLARKGTKKK